MSDNIAKAIAEIRSARPWPAGLVEKVEALLRDGSDRDLFRVNPIRFAEKHGFGETDTIDAMLFATRAGAFDMQWSLICPFCAVAVDSFATLRNVKGGFYCAICKVQAKTDLDGQVQVGFTVSPRIRKSRFHDPLALPASEYVGQYRFSTDTFTPDGRLMRDLIGPFIRICEYVKPGETIVRTIDVAAGALAFSEVVRHRDAFFTVDATAGAKTINLQILGDGLTVDAASVALGKVEVRLTNTTGEVACVTAANMDPGVMTQGGPPIFERYLTGSRLLASHAFRQLFRTEVIKGAEGLGVKDVTLLFTDLKGSTAMYERIGDLQAFSLVRAHFDRLATAVQANNGAIVKTIGDAVMAVFVTPLDAVRAAIRMQGDIEQFNRDHGARELILKIGIHSGASIAVTLNENLDYFGQTVNVAARVQAYADADEICLTDEAYNGVEVKNFLQHYPVSTEMAQLKGVQREVRVHRVRPDIAAMAA